MFQKAVLSVRFVLLSVGIGSGYINRFCRAAADELHCSFLYLNQTVLSSWKSDVAPVWKGNILTWIHKAVTRFQEATPDRFFNYDSSPSLRLSNRRLKAFNRVCLDYISAQLVPFIETTLLVNHFFIIS